jgi:hypothetical protein
MNRQASSTLRIFQTVRDGGDAKVDAGEYEKDVSSPGNLASNYEISGACASMQLRLVLNRRPENLLLSLICASLDERNCLLTAKPHEVRSILEGQRAERVYVLYFETCVHKVETFEAGQPVGLHPVGGGGTEFGPCFEWLQEHGVLPQTLVFLTDLYGRFPAHAPAYPVLWASTGRQRAPFGEVIPMNAA